MTFVVLAAAGFAFAIWRIRRVDHIAQALRETGIEPDPRPRNLCMVLICDKPWVLSIDGWRTCAEHAKAHEMRGEGA